MDTIVWKEEHGNSIVENTQIDLLLKESDMSHILAAFPIGSYKFGAVSENGSFYKYHNFTSLPGHISAFEMYKIPICDNN